MHARAHQYFLVRCKYSQETTDRTKVASSSYESLLKNWNSPTSFSVVSIISRDQLLVTEYWPNSSLYRWEIVPFKTRGTVQNRLLAKNQVILLQLGSGGRQGKVILSLFLTITNWPSAPVKIKGKKVKWFLFCIWIRIQKNKSVSPSPLGHKRLLCKSFAFFFFSSYLQQRARLLQTHSNTSSPTAFQTFFCLAPAPLCCWQPPLCRLWRPSWKNKDL